jgi:serine/threonine protein kinase
MIQACAHLCLIYSNELKSTLSAIHQHGWVHGDLRAPNVSQDSAGRFSIFDFDQAEYIAFSNPERVAQECRFVASLLKSTVHDSGCSCSTPILVEAD